MYDESKEIREAVISGEKALVSLKDAKRYLDSARNWGVVDIFGGDLFSGLMKLHRQWIVRNMISGIFSRNCMMYMICPICTSIWEIL